jgi:protein-S-isoprenylcysteine O-methyltransferase Ste14
MTIAFLETRIPPPLVVVIIAAVMWGASRALPVVQLPQVARLIAAVAIALAGIAVSLAGVLSFRAAKTTVNPLKPESASSLVASGIYNVTRNPMYVGMLLLLIAWVVFLASPWVLLGPIAFVLYMNRFQIGPEERALTALFGAQFVDYKAKARRWL